MSVVYLTRHGESRWNADHRITGQLDPRLSAAGERQALALADALRDVPLESVHSSTLVRARRTAAPTAHRHELPLQTHTALVEQHLGVLQGRWRDGRDPDAARLWAVRRELGRDFVPPGGESFAALRERVVQCLESILARSSAGPMLIVGHRNVNRVILEHLLGREDAATGALTPRSGRLHKVTLGSLPRVSVSRFDRDAAFGLEAAP